MNNEDTLSSQGMILKRPYGTKSLLGNAPQSRYDARLRAA